MADFMLHGRDVISEWTKLVDGARDQRDQFWELVIKHLEGIELSGLTWSYKIVTHKIGLTGKSKGEERKFLVVEGGTQPFKVLVGARNFGKYLAVTRLYWVSNLSQDGEDTRLVQNYFDSTTTELFGSVISIAVQDAVEDLCAGVGQEAADIKEVLKAW